MEKPSVAIVHYSCPPVIGGVESVIRSHALLMADNGYKVRIIAGKGERFRDDIDVVIVPSISSGSREVKTILDNAGDDRVSFDAHVQKIKEDLSKALEGMDICIVHNIMYMHFNLALTQALRELAPELKDIKFINWIHDATVWNPDYAEESKNTFYPWDGLRKKLEGYRTVVISDLRKQQVKELLRLDDGEITVVPNGVDIKSFLTLYDFAYEVFLKEKVAFKDIVLFTPTRVLGRKNLELGIETVRGLRTKDKTVKWLISGAPDPHNKATVKYYERLKDMIKEYGLEEDIVFLSGKYERRLSDGDITSFYRLTDILLFPSRQEGFGIPVIEAGLSKALAVVSDIPPLADLGREDAIYLKLENEDMNKKSAEIISTLEGSMSYRLFKRTIKAYPWDVIFKEKIESLLTAKP